MQNKKNKISLLLSSLFFLVFSVKAQGQQGIIKGTIKDAATEENVVGASVSIVGTSYGVTSDDGGVFLLTGIPAGTHVLQISYIGYSTIRVEDVVVKEGAETILDVNLEEAGELMDEVVVTTTRRRGSDIALLAEQKKASLVIQRIGAQELSRVGVSDAAAAVAKMSGISKEDGGSQVYIRGMGDRYNSTSFNGLPLPSNDPELKNIALDIFSTDVVEFIAVDKVYNSKMSGDFGGGSVDIYSKDYSGNGLFEVSVSSTLNRNAISHADDFRLFPGGSRIGFSEYSIPQNPLGGFNFTNSANPVSRSPYPASVRLLGGKSFNMGSEGRLNLFATAGFSNGYEYREGINNDVNAQGARRRTSDQVSFGYKTNSTGLFNASYLINPRNKVSYNFVFVNSSDQWNDSYRGYFRDITEDGTGLRQLGSYAQNKLFVNQLLGTHQLTDRIDVDWGVSANHIAYAMPDRIQNTFQYLDGQGGYVIAQNARTNNNRFNQRLDENEYAINLNGSYKIGNAEAPKGLIRFGYQGRFKKRDFESIQFYFNIANRSSLVDPNHLDAFYNQENFEAGLFSIGSFAGETPQTYNGDQEIHAGYASLEYDLTDRLTSVIGLRYENIRQYVEWVTQFDPGDNSTMTRNPILPNLNLKYELNEKQNLRLGASKTYTLPQFKERSPFQYDNGTLVKYGNPHLYPSDNYNVDLKWEMFPKLSELVSLTAFGKYVQNPINEVNVSATANDVSYVNIGDVGTVVGVELELKKDIVSWNSDRDLFSAGLNVAYMNTDQDVDQDKVAQETDFNIQPTHDRSSFTGASDLLVNADLTYTKRWNNDGSLMATIAYSHFSDKIYALGVQEGGNLVDRGLGTLDFIVRSKINRKFGIDLLVRNILDPEYRRIQENATGYVPVVTYKKGQFFMLGLSYQL